MATPAELPGPRNTADQPDPPAVETAAVETAALESAAVEPLATDRGDTKIADQVVHRIVYVVLQETTGVYLTDGPGSITVQKGERQTAVDLSVVVDYGISIMEVGRALRRRVIEAIEHGTSLEVTEVNLQITDVRLPGGSHAIRPPAARLT